MKRLSLSQKLTLVIGSVLSVLLLATFAATYRTVSSTEAIAAQETLGRLATELAGSVDAVTRRQAAALRALGSDSVVRVYGQGHGMNVGNVPPDAIGPRDDAAHFGPIYTISRELARGMGGDLEVASREGHGSVFTLTLPSGVPAARAAAATGGS